jgi:hypothetical protein
VVVVGKQTLPKTEECGKDGSLAEVVERLSAGKLHADGGKQLSLATYRGACVQERKSRREKEEEEEGEERGRARLKEARGQK